jgi:single-strand DNA-binding protein
MRFTQSGTPVTNMRVAVSNSWQGRDGEQRERTEWFTVVAWGRLAEIANEYLATGRQVYIEGRLETREWQDREGNDRTTTELVARELLMLGGRDNEDSQQIQPENNERPVNDKRPVNDDEITADDLPF